MQKDAFVTKVLESEETLYKISMSMLKNEKDCEDVVQDTILTAYNKLNSLKNESYFKTWLVRILINKCNEQLRKKKRTTPDMQLVKAYDTDNHEITEVRIALDNLPDDIRYVMVMHYIENFTIKEIQEVLKIPQGTVKSRLSRGRELLRLELK
ncbi:MAG: sigma-70 family RNA polymerase sigma factor [Acutalibacteraceae bacterium]|nr:sigma-70 family RNA polymerase sigma factor [Acutalibacteraceae bacterium]